MNHSRVVCINDVNKHLIDQPINSNQIYYSRLRQVEGVNAFRNVSIKYVLEGVEYYKVDNQEFEISAGRFLLANQQPDGEVYFHSKKVVVGICIDLHPELVQQALQAISINYKHDPEHLLDACNGKPIVLEQIYLAKHSPLYGKLRQIERLARVSEAPDLQINEDWFMELAELIAFQEQHHNRALRALDVVKRSTREEIYRRLLQGREYMDEHFLSSPPIAEVAQQCFMSEFYFFRCFKQAFGITPHQYMLRKRLRFASRLMKQKQMSISRVAIECGFPDLSTFSKTFKKHYSMTPTQFTASV